MVIALSWMALGACIAPAVAQSRLEVHADRQSLNGGFAGQAGALVRAVIEGPASSWIIDVAPRRAFGDEGVSIGVLHTFDAASWVLSAGAATSAGAFFLPRARLDAFVGRRYGQPFIGGINARYVQSTDGHRDVAFGPEIRYYSSAGVLQVSSLVNVSQPGAVVTAFHRAALTMGEANGESLMLYGGAGREGYELVGPGTTIVNFRSGMFGAIWRRWMRSGWGMTAGIERYENTAYDRLGISLGAMRRLSPGRRP